MNRKVTPLVKKIFTAFSVVTLIISGLFIFEGYEASIDFGKKMELLDLHHSLTNQLKSIEKSHFASLENNATTQHYNSGDFSVLNSVGIPTVVMTECMGKQSVYTHELKVKEDARKLINLVNNEKRLHPDLMTVYDHAHNNDHDHEKEHEITYNAFVTFKDTEYFWMAHPLEGCGEITIIQELQTHKIAKHTVFPRLIISSLILLWIGFWGSLAVSAFVAKLIAKSNKALIHSAHHDSLTGLPNSIYLDEAIKLLPKANQKATLILICLKNIDLFEQTYGSKIKEDIYKAFTSRLLEHTPSSRLVGRLNEGVFYVYIEDIGQENANDIAYDYHGKINAEIISGPIAYLPTIYFGIADSTTSSESVNKLISHASVALKLAAKNRQRVQVFSTQFSNVSEEKIKRSAELKRALVKEEFVLVYQPKINLEDNSLVGVEALVRWDHPVEGRLGPYEFIGLIESSNISQQFTQYIIRKAVEQIVAWNAEGHTIPVAVNISPYDLAGDTMIAYLRETLEETHLPPNTLEMELTENATTIDIRDTSRIFMQLGELGIKRSIDDFGQGMSSLSYLKNIPFDTVKIDRDFVKELITDPASQAIIEAVIHMAEKLQWTVVAEGAENKETVDLLKALGCHIVQGFYFAKPLEASELISYKLSLEKT